MSLRRFAGPVLASVLLAVPALADEKATPLYLGVPGTDTRLKIYGKAWFNSWFYFNQNLKENGALVGAEADSLNAASTPDRQFGMTAKNSRIGLKTTTPTTDWGDMSTTIEMDFAKGDAKNGGANLRHAYLTLGGWTVGYTDSNWLDGDAGGETVDNCGPIGQACNGGSRFTQVRYTWEGVYSRFALGVEQNTQGWGKFKDTVNEPEEPTRPDARYPTVIAALTVHDSWGHLALRGLEQDFGAYTPAVGSAARSRPNHWGSAVQLSGLLHLGEDKLVGSVYTGEGLGSYGPGFQAVRFPGGSDDFHLYRNFGWQAGYTRNWSKAVRSNIVASGLGFNTNAAMAPESISRARSAFVNTFVKLNRSMEVGLEYGFEDLKTSGAGQVTLRDGRKSDQNRSNKVQLCWTANF